MEIYFIPHSTYSYYNEAFCWNICSVQFSNEAISFYINLIQIYFNHHIVYQRPILASNFAV